MAYNKPRKITALPRITALSNNDLIVVEQVQGSNSTTSAITANNLSSSLQAKPSNKILIADGIAPPGAITGYAQIYIDTTDGDLKIIFSDGTIKTIVTD